MFDSGEIAGWAQKSLLVMVAHLCSDSVRSCFILLPRGSAPAKHYRLSLTEQGRAGGFFALSLSLPLPLSLSLSLSLLFVCVAFIILMEICKVPTLWLKVLNKHHITHTMYIEMENVICNLTKANA